MVDRIFLTTQFISGVKQLRKKHKTAELQKLGEVIVKLQEMSITTEYDNHKLSGSTAELSDIHIADDLILLYRYETDHDDKQVLCIDLRLDNLVNHDKLSRNANVVHNVKRIVKPLIVDVEKTIKNND